MKIATAGLIALVLFLSTVTARADSSEYIQDDDGCWTSEGPTCVWHDSFWDNFTIEPDESPPFISRYRNDCDLRILLKVCHQALVPPYSEERLAENPELAGSFCVFFVTEPGEVEVLLTNPWNEPTGQSEFRWIGSTIADKDWVCADKSGLNDWRPDW